MAITKLDRIVLRLSGEKVDEWLSGLITNSLDADINFAALLTPQGKIISDFFVIKDKNDLLIDAPADYVDGLKKRLSMYKLRAPITITETDLSVYAAWGGTGDEGYADPRRAELGRRIYADYLECEGDPEAYDIHRLELGVPDSSQDFKSGEIFPANANMDFLNGVDFKKGCFVGQEVVSRMHRKTNVKKRMQGFRSDGAITETDLIQSERVVGTVMHLNDMNGMAMVRQDRLADDGSPIRIGSTEVKLMELNNGV